MALVILVACGQDERADRGCEEWARILANESAASDEQAAERLRDVAGMTEESDVRATALEFAERLERGEGIGSLFSDLSELCDL